MRRHLTGSLLGVAILLGAECASAQNFLGKSASTWTRELERPEETARRNAAYALGKMGFHAAPAITPLMKRLSEDASPKVREAAAVALGEIGKESKNPAALQAMVPALIQALKDANHLVRRSAAYALGNLGAGAAGAQVALSAAADDPRPEVRQNVAWAQGRIGAAGMPSMRKALGDADSLVKRDAASALAPLDPKTARQALAELVPLCAENNSELRRAALNVLVKIVGPEDAAALATIRQALLDPDADVRTNAALAMSNIGGKDAAAAVPVLLDSLRRGDIDQRRLAAAAFKNIGPDAADAVPELIKALRDPDLETRGFAALALGGIGPGAESAVPALVEIIADRQEKSETRVEAAVALSRIGAVAAAVQAVPTLLKVLQDSGQDAKVRERIVWAIRVHAENLRNLPGIYPTFTKILAEAGSESTKMLRYDCAYMLGVLQQTKAPPKALDVLLEYLKDDKITIFKGKKTSVGGTGQETSSGKANVEEVGKGDGRVMAVQALTDIGAARVNERPDIVQQLQLLADDQATNADLGEACKKLLKTLK